MGNIVGHSPSSCAYAHCFNVAESAGHLAAFAGVLAALTFSAIIYLAGKSGLKRNGLEDTLITMYCGLVALLFATYLFAESAAEERGNLRVASGAFMASLILAIAVLYLFLGIMQLMSTHEYNTVSRFVGRTARWLISPAVFAFLGSSAVNAWGLNKTEAGAWESMLGYTCIGLAAVFVVYLVSLSHIPRLRNVGRNMKPRTWAHWSLVLVVVPSVLDLIWSERGRVAALPASIYIAAIVGVFVSLVIYCALLAGLADDGSQERVIARGATRSVPPQTRPLPYGSRPSRKTSPRRSA
jgi:hypothetical protein